MLDTDGSDFDHYAGISQYGGESFRSGILPMKLKIQFVAVPAAAPFVLIAKELISVG